MKYENVKFGNDCREKLIEGVNLCVKAVETTYGPNGRNSLIMTQEGVKITKDGFHTAMAINDSDPYVMMGIKLVQDTCKKTAKDVGDGTSTTAILIREIVNSYKDHKNPILISRQLKEWGEQAVNLAKERAIPVSDYSDILNIASLSANNDQVIGSLIAGAFDRVGKDGIVTFEESDDVKDRVDYSEGFRIDNGYSSPYFVNTPKGNCELTNVIVHISDTKMSEVNRVIELADSAVKQHKSLLLIAPDFDSEILVFLSSNKELLKACTVISPCHRNFREIMLEDMKILLGTSMECKKVIVSKNHTTFLGCDNNKEQVEARIKEIRDIIKEGDLSEFDLNFHKKRLANFTSGIATIYVGGYSKVEMKERYDRIEDAVCATQAAMKEGYVKGGGVTLKEISYSLFKDSCSTDEGLFTDILEMPSKLLGIEEIDRKVIEPFLVTKTTLENAISTASLILTADVAILNMYEF